MTLAKLELELAELLLASQGREKMSADEMRLSFSSRDDAGRRSSRHSPRRDDHHRRARHQRPEEDDDVGLRVSGSV